MVWNITKDEITNRMIAYNEDAWPPPGSQAAAPRNNRTSSLGVPTRSRRRSAPLRAVERSNTDFRVAADLLDGLFAEDQA